MTDAKKNQLKKNFQHFLREWLHVALALELKTKALSEVDIREHVGESYYRYVNEFITKEESKSLQINLREESNKLYNYYIDYFFKSCIIKNIEGTMNDLEDCNKYLDNDS